jgi:hypothetical protein
MRVSLSTAISRSPAALTWQALLEV